MRFADAERADADALATALDAADEEYAMLSRGCGAADAADAGEGYDSAEVDAMTDEMMSEDADSWHSALADLALADASEHLLKMETIEPRSRR